MIVVDAGDRLITTGKQIAHMKHLEEVFGELPESEQRKIEQRARKRGCHRLEYLGELLEKDLEHQSAAIRRVSARYRFAHEEDFSVKTFMQWLRVRHGVER